MIQIKKFESYGYNDIDVIEKANLWIKENYNKMHIIEVKNLVKESNYTCIILVYEELKTLGVGEVKIEIPKKELVDYNPVKKYLKWEDLEFDRKEEKYMKVSLNGTKYCLVLTWNFCEHKMAKVKPINLYEEKKIDGQTIFLLDGNYINDVQFFNDLRLEVVE